MNAFRARDARHKNTSAWHWCILFLLARKIPMQLISVKCSSVSRFSIYRSVAIYFSSRLTHPGVLGFFVSPGSLFWNCLPWRIGESAAAAGRAPSAAHLMLLIWRADNGAAGVEMQWQLIRNTPRVNLQPFIPPTPIIYDDFPSLQLFPVPFFAPAMQKGTSRRLKSFWWWNHSRKNAPEAPTPPPLIISYRFFLYTCAPSEKSRACYCAACREGFILIPFSLSRSNGLCIIMCCVRSSARLSRSRDAPWEFSTLDARLFIVSNDNKQRPMLILAV